MKYTSITRNNKRRRSRDFKRQLKKLNIASLMSDSEDDPDYDPDNEEGKDELEDLLFGEHGVWAEENHIYFRTEVNSGSVEKLIKLIDQKNRDLRDIRSDPCLKRVDPKPIYLHITSYGGGVFSGLRAMDAIIRSNIPVHTIVDGQAATLMSIVGERRYITPNSYILIHQLSSESGGKFWEMKDEYKNNKELMERFYKIYDTYTYMSIEEIKEQLTHDNWWSAETCLEKGLVDELYESNL